MGPITFAIALAVREEPVIEKHRQLSRKYRFRKLKHQQMP